jgi:hypothetical protein
MAKEEAQAHKDKVNLIVFNDTGKKKKKFYQKKKKIKIFKI